MQADLIAEKAMTEGALQRHGELAQLVELLQRKPPKTVLEIGTHMGGTLRAWTLCAADDALLVSVDMEGGQFGGAAFYRHPHIQTFAEGSQRLVLLEGDSHDGATAAAIMDALGKRKVDFLFIDGDHSYEGVKQDFEAYSPLVRKGGIIALHDTEVQPEDRGVEAHLFWEALEFVYDTERFRTEGSYAGCGIGVIHWDGPR